MLNIGIIGLGSIAKKAYLPVYLNIQDKVNWHIFTRSSETKLSLISQYGFNYVYDDFEKFKSLSLDGVFIHTPTYTHYDLVTTFLNLNIPVYVDKPLAENYYQVVELYDLAKEKDLFLMTGFNRRFSPHILKLKEIKDYNMILATKHRPNLKAGARFALFDEMIHVVDTTLFLFEVENFQADYHLVLNQNNLEHASITFKTTDKTAIALMNLKAGYNFEKIDVMSPKGYYSVENLNTFFKFDDTGRHYNDFNDWAPIEKRRGFLASIEYFINGLNKGYHYHENHNKISLASHYHIDKLAEKLKKA